MANTRSAEKRIRQTETRTLRNKMIKSRVKTALRRFREAVTGGEGEQLRTAFTQAVSALDKAARKGIIHRNEANRRKTRLARDLSKAQGA